MKRIAVYCGSSTGNIKEYAIAAKSLGLALVKNKLGLVFGGGAIGLMGIKALIAELSDGFIAMPGGLGTIEEIFEVLTWSQLGIHTKPCGFLNVLNYFNHLINFLDHMTDQNFINEKHRSMIIIEENPEILLVKLKTYKHQEADKSAWALNMLKN